MRRWKLWRHDWTDRILARDPNQTLPQNVPTMVHSPSLRVVFYRSPSGREPVRDWIRDLDSDTRRILGEDIKTVQLGWPLGMPLVRSLGGGIWEIRSHFREGIGRVLFLAEDDTMVLLHGFLKKSRKTPHEELEIARKRAAAVRQGDQK
jgi:phage-related protein